MDEISLLDARAGSSPTGTGSFSYFTNVSVVVQNIAFAKVVGVWGIQALQTGLFSRAVMFALYQAITKYGTRTLLEQRLISLLLNTGRGANLLGQ